MDWLTWGALILGASGLILDLVLILDAVYQIAYEKPSFIGLEKAMFNRVPATPEDCFRQEAGKLLLSAGLLLGLLPILVTTILNASGWHGDIWGRKAIGIVGLACAALALYLVISGGTVLRKVRFAYLGRTVNQP